MKLFSLFLTLSILFSACKDKQSINIEHDEQYEKSKKVLHDAEKKNPKQFVELKYSNKKNAVGKTVVNGVLFNTAKVITYKDFEVKHQFYSKTGALLGENVETIYEEISPGGSRPFKSKYMAPKSSDSVVVTLLSAKVR